MKRLLILLFTTILIFLFITTCDRSDNPPPEDIQEFGYLSLQVGLKIEASPARRTEAVDPSDFLVTIHDASNGSEVMRFNTYAEVPDEVQLPTGSYFVRATNLEFPADAAFEQPWYFGESNVFTIDKEEIKAIDVTCTLTNCKISFVYSQHVLDNFTNWNATATINDGSGNGDSLEWIQSDPAEGYFITDFPIDIAVHLEYEKAFSNELITRNFNTTISTPLPATHYRININAALEDGKIVINLTVDDSFETVNIELGDQTSFRSCKEILLSGQSIGDGIYEIDPDGAGSNQPYNCYCDMTTDGGGWTRVWGYVLGTTDHVANGIAWHDALNRIPQETDNVYTGLNIWNEIMGELPNGELMYTWQLGGEFKAFRVGIQKFDVEDNYTIKLSNFFLITPGATNHGLFEYHNNQPFTTFDHDNDPYSGNCSISSGNRTPFWYNNCWSESFWGYGNGSGSNWFGLGTGYYYVR